MISNALAITPGLSVGWLATSIVLMVASLVLVFVPRMPACILGYLAMWAAQLSGYVVFSDTALIFWGVATVIVVINNVLLPGFVRNSSQGLGYIGGGALAGMAVGLTLYRAASVVGGAIIGAVLGAVAYGRTRRGANLEFPTVKFFNYLGAKGIPAVVASSMAGLILSGFIMDFLVA